MVVVVCDNFLVAAVSVCVQYFLSPLNLFLGRISSYLSSSRGGKEKKKRNRRREATGTTAPVLLSYSVFLVPTLVPHSVSLSSSSALRGTVFHGGRGMSGENNWNKEATLSDDVCAAFRCSERETGRGRKF